MISQPYAQDIFKQTHRRGTVLLGYGLLWLAGPLAGYFLLDSLLAGPGLVNGLLLAAGAATLAGGLGGTTAMLERLYQSVSLEQNFQTQSTFSYLLQPLSGLLFGLLSFLLLTVPLALVVNFAFNGQLGFNGVLETSTFAATLMLIGWLAGFYRRRSLARLKRAGDDEPAATASLDPLAELPLEPLDENAPLFFKAWAQRQREITRWSATWGAFLFGYGLLWLAGLFAFYLLQEQNLLVTTANPQRSAPLNLLTAAWPAAIAGGAGGVVYLLQKLYQHVSIQQDFHRQHVMAYLVQPPVGFVFGLVIYLFVGTGYLSLTALGPNEAPPVVDAPSLLMIQLVIGWLAGFRQQVASVLVERFIAWLVRLSRLSLSLLHPRNLFNNKNRAEIWSQIKAEAGILTPRESLLSEEEETSLSAGLRV